MVYVHVVVHLVTTTYHRNTHPHSLLERLYGCQFLEPEHITLLHVSTIMHSLALLRFAPPLSNTVTMLTRMLHCHPLESSTDPGLLRRLFRACHQLQVPLHVADTATLLMWVAAWSSSGSTGSTRRNIQETAATAAYACASMHADDLEALMTLHPHLQAVVRVYDTDSRGGRCMYNVTDAHRLVQAHYLTATLPTMPGLLGPALLGACEEASLSNADTCNSGMRQQVPAQELAHAAHLLGWFEAIHLQYVVLPGVPAVDVLGVLPDGQEVVLDMVLPHMCFANQPRRVMGERALMHLLLATRVGHVVPVMYVDWAQVGGDLGAKVELLRTLLLGHERVVEMLAANKLMI